MTRFWESYDLVALSILQSASAEIATDVQFSTRAARRIRPKNKRYDRQHQAIEQSRLFLIGAAHAVWDNLPSWFFSSEGMCALLRALYGHLKTQQSSLRHIPIL